MAPAYEFFLTLEIPERLEALLRQRSNRPNAVLPIRSLISRVRTDLAEYGGDVPMNLLDSVPASKPLSEVKGEHLQ
jgi:hypothetical protein